MLNKMDEYLVYTGDIIILSDDIMYQPVSILK